MTEQQMQLFDGLSYYEGIDVEYKAARGGLPRDLWETYSAFANTEGGTLWLGITQHGGVLDVHGVTDAEKLVGDFWNTLNNRGKVNRNLFQFYQRVILKLGSGPGIKSPFQTDAEGYRQAGSPVHEALQEALVNALIHADYSGQGGIVIERYPNRFEFSNPGTLLVSREQILHGGVSECRNKSLQSMFQRLGVGDKAGSGIDKIRQSWAAQHWQSPSLQETLRPDRVQLVLPMVSMLPEATVQELRARFGEAFEQLDRNEVQAVVTAALEDEVSNLRLQEILPLHRVDITKLLQGLVRKKLLAPEGFGRWTRYALRDYGNDRGSPANDGSSPANDASSLCDNPAEVIDRVRNSGRADTVLVERAILMLCAGKFQTAAELGVALNRSPDRLKNGYLFSMAARGLLEQRYPDSRTHRNQAYRAVARAE